MKKISIFLLALALTTVGAKAQTILLGDATGDGIIDITDVTTTVNIILGKTTATQVRVGGGPEQFIRDNCLTGTYLVDEATKTYKSGYEYIDLGLPSHTLWCATNVGALVPSDQGTVTAWDAVTLPQGWYLPTPQQVEELLAQCTVTEDGDCLKVASKADASKYILIPKSTPKFWQADGTSFSVVTTSVSTVYLRPVTTAPDSTEIGQGEDNADLE